jgi:hypothetical protein
MAARGCGSIVNITTMAAEFGMAGAGVYGRSLIVALTRTRAAECVVGNVRVNAVSPGPTTTEGTTEAMGPDAIEHVGSTVPLKRPATVEESPAWSPSPHRRALAMRSSRPTGGAPPYRDPYKATALLGYFFGPNWRELPLLRDGAALTAMGTVLVRRFGYPASPHRGASRTVCRLAAPESQPLHRSCEDVAPGDPRVPAL